MNLLFGSSSEAHYHQLRDAVANRYSLDTRQTWEHPNSRGGYACADASPLIGHATDPSSKVSLCLIGILNESNKGLSGDATRDATTALNAYLDDPTDGLSKLDGQFLIALSDPLNNLLLILPDPNGLRSAYYTEHLDGTVSFSTNLSTLAEATPGQHPADDTYQNFFLSHGFFPFNHSAFKGIKQIPAGHILRVTPSTVALQTVTQTQRWSQQIDAIDFSLMSEEAVIDLLHEFLGNAVKEQLSPDPKVGVLLGGFDSALVAAYLCQAGKEVHTYSFYYEDERYNQAHTDTVAKHLGCTHHWIPINSKVIARGIEEFDLYFNSPTNWLNYVIQTEEVCRQIQRDGIRHVYSGDGCDATFLGYPRVHATSAFFKRMGKWPSTLTNGLIHLFDSAWLENLCGRPYTVAMHLLRTLAREMPERGFLTFRILDENSIRHMKAPHYVAAEQDDESLLKAISAPLKGKSADRIAYGGKGFLSPNRSKIIGSSDSVGITIQAPYLHPGLKALALKLPDELCRPTNQNESKETGKYILMRMALDKKLLPHDAIYQKKIAAVDAPIDDWLKEDLAKTGKHYLESLPFTINPQFRDSLFRKKAIEELHRKYVASDSLTTHGLSLLLTYSRLTRLTKDQSD